MSRYLTVRNLFVGCSVVLTLGFAVVAGYRPDHLPPSVGTYLDQLTGLFGLEVIVIAVGGILACIGLLGSWVWRPPTETGALSDASVTAPDREVAVTGAALTSEFEYKRDGFYRSERSIEDSLRRVVVETYSHQFDDPDRAVGYVDNGAWTDDTVAAATLTTTDAVDFSLAYRLYAWLYPTHAYTYRIQRTLRAVETTCSVELTQFSPPARTRGRLGRLRALFGSESGGDQ